MAVLSYQLATLLLAIGTAVNFLLSLNCYTLLSELPDNYDMDGARVTIHSRRIRGTVQEPLLFHFIHTTDEASFKPFNLRIIESVFYHHPNARVIFHVPKQSASNMTSRPLRPLMDAGYSIDLRYFDLESLLDAALSQTHSIVNATAAASWMKKMPEYSTKPYWYSHFTDLVRLLVLYKQGGVYLDTDVVVVKPFYELTNVLGWEDTLKIQANGAVLKFEQENIFIGKCINEYFSSYRHDDWGYNGPGLVTRVWKRSYPRCEQVVEETETSFRIQKITEKADCPVTMMPATAFYPIAYWSMGSCFDSWGQVSTLPERKGSETSLSGTFGSTIKNVHSLTVFVILV
jgi:lactosylceramide 4-alpha-galactosyltransferase